MLPNTQHLVLVVFMVLGSLNSAMADDPVYTIEPIPSWVAPVPAFGPSELADAELEHGYHDRLSDLQINGTERGNTRIYNAVEFSLTNNSGVENFSNIEITFDPTFQTLTLHELIVKRNGVQVNRLDTTNFNVIPSNLNEIGLTYNGTRTLSGELDDVQVGDTIRYSYSVTGDNPVFAGNREYHVNTEVWTQLDRQHVRILSAANDSLNRRTRGAHVSLAVKDSQGIQEMVFDQRGVAKFQTERGVPSWHQAQGALVFSDMNSWQDVVDWAQPLYQLPKNSTEEVSQIATAIKLLHGQRDEQIGAALSWVQKEITFYDVKLGAYSPRPAKPATTLTRRFGGVQDKVLLVIAILAELNIEAHAALVNTQRGLEAGDYPFRMHAFDHVVVHVERNGESHFIDPTRNVQSGALGEIYEPNYGRALVLSPNAVGLVAMDDSRSIAQQWVRKELTLPSQRSDLVRTSMRSDENISEHAAGLRVTSQKEGLLAEQTRESLDIGGERALNETYLDYYQVLFPSIATIEPVRLSENADNNSTFVENYSIENFWNSNEKVGDHRWLYADEIIGYLDVPEKTENRKRPYELRHPVSISETWIVQATDNVRMLLEEASIDNEWVSFSKTVFTDEDDKKTTIKFVYTTLSNEVAARDLEIYAESIEQINDQASFYLQYAPALAAGSPALAVPWNTATVKFWVIFLAMIYFFGWSLHFLKRCRKSVDYYSDEEFNP